MKTGTRLFGIPFLALALLFGVTEKAGAALALFGVDSVTDELFTLNTTTGEATVVGSLGVNITGSALAFDPNTELLYLTDNTTDTLYTVNPFTGAAAAIGLTGIDSIGGLAFDPNGNVLYGADSITDNLITFNTGTGAGSPVGPFGSDIQGNGLAYDPISDTLYISNAGTDNSLYTINTSTGAGSLVGPFGLGGIRGLAFDSLNGILYGTTQSQLATINTLTGAATAVGPHINAGDLFSLAFAVPEPSRALLLVVGATCVLGIRRRRRALS